MNAFWGLFCDTVKDILIRTLPLNPRKATSGVNYSTPITSSADILFARVISAAAVNRFPVLTVWGNSGKILIRADTYHPQVAK